MSGSSAVATAAVTAATAATTSFAQDDEETWRVLIDLNAAPSSPSSSSSSSSPDLASLLSGMAVRLQEDWQQQSDGGSNGDSAANYWKALTARVAALGFSYSDASPRSIKSSAAAAAATTTTTTTTPSPPPPPPPPAAFETEAGKAHLAATAAFLHLSPERAQQVTLGTLRSIDAVIHPTTTISTTTTTTTGDSNNSNLSSLLGTPSFLVQTVLYHYRQRTARLNIVVECLRLEQDPELGSSSSSTSAAAAAAASATAMVQFLDSLDGTFINNSNSNKTGDVERGLFQSLVQLVGRPGPSPSLTALEPARKLLQLSSSSSSSSSKTRASSSFVGGQNIADADADAAWSDFCSHLLWQERDQVQRERQLALETLLVLLYERIDGGVQRDDYALLLTAFGTPHHHNHHQHDHAGVRGGGSGGGGVFEPAGGWFATDQDGSSGGDGTALNNLLALLCAECMALWRAFADDTDHNTGGGSGGGSSGAWVARHPLLSGPADQVQHDVERLILLLEAQVQNDESNATGPASVALLSFGLMLCLAHDAIMAQDAAGGVSGRRQLVRDWRTKGTELVQRANDDAFSFLNDLLDDSNPNTGVEYARTTNRDNLYEWIARHDKQVQVHDDNDDDENMLLENIKGSVGGNAARNLSANIITYTSIAREVMAASISAFAGSLLEIYQDSSCSNIGVLCKLVSKIYRNNQPLLEQFWAEWDVYQTSDSTSKQTRYPICALLDTSYSLALEAFKAVSEKRVPQEFFLSAATPFLQLASSLCDNAIRVAATLETLPPTFIRDVLLSCGGLSSVKLGSELAGATHRILILESIELISSSAKASKFGLEQIRDSFESADGRGRLLEGPKILARLLYGQRDHQIIKPVFGIMSQLLFGASSAWILALFREFSDHSARTPLSGLTAFLTMDNFDLSIKAVTLLGAYVDCMGKVLSSNSAAVSEAATFVHGIGGALVSAITFLASSSLSTSTATRPSIETADCILQECSNFLTTIRPIIARHDSKEIRDVAYNSRNALISAFSTGTSTGEVIVYYAILPVSINILLKMEELLGKEAIEQEMSDTPGVFPRSLMPRSRGSATVTEVLDFVSKLNSSDISLDQAVARGWIPSMSTTGSVIVMEAAMSAVRLVADWSLHAKDLARSSHGQSTEFIAHLSPEALLCSLAPAPFPCIESTTMERLWKSLGLSSFELLLPYLSKRNISPGRSDIPSASTLELLANTLAIDFLEGGNDSMLIISMRRFTQFSSALADMSQRGIELIAQPSNDFSQEEEDEVLHAFLSLRIMSTAAASGLSTALTVFRVDKYPGLVDLLGRSSLSADKIITSIGRDGISLTQDSFLEMFMASSSLDVLAGLWKTARAASTSNTGAEGVDLAKTLAGQSDFIQRLAGVLSAVVSVFMQWQGAARASLMKYLASASQILYTEFALCSSDVILGDDDLFKLAQASIKILSVDLSDLLDERTRAMAPCLSGLVLFLLERDNGKVASLVQAIKMLNAVVQAIENTPVLSGESETKWSVHQNLFGVALLLQHKIEMEVIGTSSGSDDTMGAYTALTVAICQFLRFFENAVENDEAFRTKSSMYVMRICTSLLTNLIVIMPEALKSIVAKTLVEYDTLKLIMKLNVRLSGVVAISLSKTRSAIHTKGDDEMIVVVQSALKLAFAVADKNDPAILEALYCVELSQMVVWNPLFGIRAPTWSALESRRGYEFEGKTAEIAAQGSPVFVGKTDAIFQIWIESVLVLGAMVRTLSHWQTTLAQQHMLESVVGLSSEFIETFRDPLCVCLKLCCEWQQQPAAHGLTHKVPTLTRNLLGEATATLALVSELCKRGTRDLLSPSAKALCNHFVGASKEVVTSLGRFVASGAHARTLFIMEMKSGDADPFGELAGPAVPDAKHQAIKYSHFTLRRRDMITAQDYMDATIVPAYLSDLGNKRGNEELFEHNCRLYVANRFAMDMENAAAECLSRALCLIWRTHAASMSFYAFSGSDSVRSNMMGLVSPGAVIAYRSLSPEDQASGLAGVRFGKVLNVDSVSSQLEVAVLQQAGITRSEEGKTEIVNANECVGIEDTAMRKPSTIALAAAPESVDAFEKAPLGELSTGVYIMILEWCQAQASLHTSLDTAMKPPPIVQQLAEEALVLLAADLVLHGENGDFQHLDKKQLRLLDAQVFDLVADKAIVEDNSENLQHSSTFSEGKLMKIVDSEMWNLVQPQVRPMVARAWKEKLERQAASKKRRDSFSSSRRKNPVGW